MSVLFGNVHFDGASPDRGRLVRAGAYLAPYASNGVSSYGRGPAEFLFGSFPTTLQSRNAIQPWTSASGHVWMWDGRLDNRDELVALLSEPLPSDAQDVVLIAEVYDELGSDCFSRLLGDWALSIWRPKDSSVLLARDFLGSRTLYYRIRNNELIWSTVLDAVLAYSGDSFALSERYLAGWFSQFPEAHLTPYGGIQGVPPGSTVRISSGGARIHQFWKFSPKEEIRYCSDAEYEEHFRTALAKSVKRRLHSHLPVVAELSGGRDSSGIVCMADRVLSGDHSIAPVLHTVSYYDEAEPNWRDHRYFIHVEEQRGWRGCHIDIGRESLFAIDDELKEFVAIPFSQDRKTPAAQKFAHCMSSRNARVLLSGIGGDEVLGGVPDPVPELAELLWCCRWQGFWTQLAAWAILLKRPALWVVMEVFRSFLHPPERPVLSFWLRPGFQERQRHALRGGRPRFRATGPGPLFEDQMHTLEFLRRQIASAGLSRAPVYEKRYPYLDRDFLELLFALPPGQLQRPEERRSLMRRSLRGIVPDPILDRRHKAHIARTPMLDLAARLSSLETRTYQISDAAQQLIDPSLLRQALDRAVRGDAVLLIPLLRTFALDVWLRALERSGYWNGDVVEG